MVIIIRCEKCGTRVGCVGEGKYLFCDQCQTRFCETFLFDEEYTAFCAKCI